VQQTQLPRDTLDIARQGAFESPIDHVIETQTGTDLTGEGGGDLNADTQETECKQRIALQAETGVGDSDLTNAVNVVCRQAVTEIDRAGFLQQQQGQSNIAPTP